MKPTVSVFLLAAVLSLPRPAPAQKEEPAGEFGELIEVTEVFLDVMATDRKGNVVPGLGEDDFIVEEDGEPVELTSVGFYTTHYDDPFLASLREEKEQEGESMAAVVPASRYFILFFHDQTLSSTPANRLLRQQLDAARKAHDWVETGLSGSDWVAVVSYDVKLKVHQDFTQDRARVAAAIDEAAVSKDPGVLPPSERNRIEAGSELSLWRGLPDSADLAKETRRIYDAVRLVAEASRPVVGRKNLVLFSIGFGDVGVGLRPTRPDERYYPAMEQALNDANVAVYAVDLTPPEFEHAQSDFLTQLADDTGGYYYQNIVNFRTPLERIGEETTGYYLLSFRTEHPAGESGYREVKVKAKSGKIRLRTRRGYRYGVGG